MKAFVEEAGSHETRRAIAGSETLASSILGRVECAAAFARAHRDGRVPRRQLRRMLEALDRSWRNVIEVALDEGVAAGAVELLDRHPLRASDAIHLSSARVIAPEDGGVTFACFDRRLWEAAGALGFERVPAQL